MKCQDAEQRILLHDSGEMPPKQAAALESHLRRCEPCNQFQQALAESHKVFQIQEEPSAKALQNVLREARRHAPEKKQANLWFLKPALAMAAVVAIALGFFFSTSASDKVGMELTVSKTQLMEGEDQMVSLMYDGLSEDDLAFNFLMTYEGTLASL
ncbi:hypothetical protein PDESU_01525 [Pontiella desulfatans]|uniref:Putative zinc-finger domain-containing protein n=1 Tax=Pontiella desulfatans TaxID=2750659 RepID=A0A6C2U048_PONDE|nr:zf-HC2 domain-containing protein [Pontiella desulfatans]VGO12971.1 hypothetical protein PDESU_01525 [Pontiella desulfatans]